MASTNAGELDVDMELYKRDPVYRAIMNMIHIPEELEKVAKVAEQREDFQSLYKLGKLANKIHPETLLGTFYLAQSAEQLGKTKKAKKLYEAALVLNDALNIDKEYITAKIEELTIALVDVDDEIEEIENEEEVDDEEK